MPRKVRVGRKAKGHNRGYFYRPGRGWFSLDRNRKFVALLDENGGRLRDPAYSADILRAGHARFLATQKLKPAVQKSGVTVLEVCDRYLAHAEKQAAPATFEGRGRTLYDFCYGFPAKVLARQEEADSCRPNPQRLRHAACRGFDPAGCSRVGKRAQRLDGRRPAYACKSDQACDELGR